jgi:proteic killer suppression protein
MPIKNFGDKKLEKFFETGNKKKIKLSHVKKLALILDRLDAAEKLKDMNYPGANFHKLKGALRNFYSVHVNGNFVVIFRFKNGNAYDVKYLDYH